MNTGSRHIADIAAFAAILLGAALAFPAPAQAARLKDVAVVKGVRENILIGYGIVVGLKGTGDSNSAVTGQSLTRLFTKLGLDVAQDAGVNSKNAAAVIVTAKLPPFARVGNKIDVTVSSIGDATSLEGGTLLVTPLRAGDQNVYAVAQGALTIGSVADGTTTNFPTVGRVVSGATIEKDLELNFAGKKSFRLSLHNPDFTTSARVVTLINAELGGQFATARDSATIDVVVPFSYEGNSVELLARLENVNVVVDSGARVVLNERTGTVIMGENITVSPVAIAHGDLAIEVGKQQAQEGGARAKIERVMEIKKTTNVSDLVRALNTMGVRPKDMTSIFQALREAGALQAELEFM
ncbi:MAG: flagellar basal body P-ring protein FlgI [Bdellovibrionales bacterium]|nr:flagellar basal body P-ring protein FlgI [Bdellovibrionales bacterium]